MSADYSEFHGELRAVARDLLGGAVGRPIDNRRMAGAGWLGLEVGEDLDGSGATFAEVAVILQEMGRSLVASDYVGTAVLGVGALNLAETSKLRDDLLRRVAGGEVALAVAVPTGEDTVIPFLLDDHGGRRLTGHASFLPDAGEADHVLLLARDPAPVLVVVDRGWLHGPDVALSEQPVLDSSRKLASISADGADIGDFPVLRFRGDAESAALTLLDRSTLATACDSLGLAEAMMEATVIYAGHRNQFGRPIGSFQAVKHACADMYVEIQICRQLVNAAVDRTVARAADAGLAASMAKAHVCDAAVGIVGKAMQLHGGVGYTWEAGIHAYLKRATLNRSLFGSGRTHRQRVAARYGQPAPTA